jgi:hypothetical protein
VTKKPPDPRLDELAKIMEIIMDLSGLSRREMARRLGGDYGVRRILDGSPELRVRQLLSFADAVEMKPVEILRVALGDDGRPSPMALRLQEKTRQLLGLYNRLQQPVANAPVTAAEVVVEPPVPDSAGEAVPAPTAAQASGAAGRRRRGKRSG